LYIVFPYREILPEELCINLLKYFLNTNYKPINETNFKETRGIVPEAQVKKIVSANFVSKIITAKLISK
jgi:hypothetical protein